MARGLDGKVIVVAGAGSGIGAETARRLAAEGCRVVVGDYVRDNAHAVADAIAADGGTAAAVQFDQSDDASVAALVATAIERFGQLDGIHANAADMAALWADGDALSVSLETFDRTIAVNQRGYLLCTRHALPHLVESRGAIVYTSSGAAFAGEAVRVSYAMSKAAILALTRHVASRWGREGVRANAIAPGFVLTPENSRTITDEFTAEMLATGRSWRMGAPADIAAMVALLFSDEGEWINGQTISVDGGATMR